MKKEVKKIKMIGHFSVWNPKQFGIDIVSRKSFNKTIGLKILELDEMLCELNKWKTPKKKSLSPHNIKT